VPRLTDIHRAFERFRDGRGVRLSSKELSMRVIIVDTLFLTTLLLTVSPTAPSVAQQAVMPLPARQAPLVPLKNPPGDIPDNQAFVEYRSPLGFVLKTPEGWPRRELPDGVVFADKYGTVAVEVTASAAPPTIASAKQGQAVALEALPTAVAVSKVTSVTLPSGPVTMIAYASNSAPNAVTGKAIRLENEQYLLWQGGKLATLTLSAPFGADNVDQWQLMVRSFQWN